jgi:NitT/TauT family transport system permease protein
VRDGGAGGPVRRALEVVGVPLGVPLACVAAWEIAVRALAIPAHLLPPPSAVVAEMAAKASLLWTHGVQTLHAIVLGFAISAVVGIALGVLLTSWWWLDAAVFPLLVFSQTVPKVAVAPLLMIWFGFGMRSKVLVTCLIAFFPVLIDTMLGLRATPTDMVLLARSTGAGGLTILAKFRLPYALPYIFGGLRIAVVFAVTGTVVSEFVGAESGLVYLMLVAQGQHQTALVFAIVVLLSVLSVALFGAVELAERRVIPWYGWMRREAGRA